MFELGKVTFRAMIHGMLGALGITLTSVIAWGMLTAQADEIAGGLVWSFIIAGYVAVYGLIGWGVVVLPLTMISKTKRLFGHPKLNEVWWVFLALLAYALLVALWAGKEAWLFAWIPAALGFLVGLSFRRIGKRAAGTVER